MPEALNTLKFSKLKPTQFDEIILWDNGHDSFFRFLNPLKITKENLLGLLKNEHNLFFTVKNEKAESAQAIIGFTHFHPIHKTAQVSWAVNSFKPLANTDLIEMLYQFSGECFSKYGIRKIQYFTLEKEKHALVEKIGAIKEGSYQKYFYSDGELKDVPAYRLFQQERKQ